jgi:hypothetical protein
MKEGDCAVDEPSAGYHWRRAALILLSAAYAPVGLMCLVEPRVLFDQAAYLPILPLGLTSILVEGGIGLLLKSGFGAVLALGHVLAIGLLVASAVILRGRFHKGFVWAIAFMTFWMSTGSTLCFVGCVYASSC